MKKISVIVPTFNRPALLIRCLKALCNQSFPLSGFEIRIVTDGPDEKTKKAVDSFRRQHSFLPEISLLQLSEKAGPAAARNMGWRTAKAKHILFTDDDTFPDKHWISAYAAAFSKQTSPVAFTGKIVVPKRPVPTDYERNIGHLETADFVTANCACSRDALDTVNGFDEMFTMAWREDSDLEFKFISNKIPIYKIEDALVVHPVRRAPWGVSLLEQKKSMFNALLYKKFPRLFKEKIMPAPLWNYYGMVTAATVVVIGVLTDARVLALVAVVVWLLLLFLFTAKRLRGSSRSTNHVLEMILTSAVIPFVSVFWTIYGAIKFRVIFL